MRDLDYLDFSRDTIAWLTTVLIEFAKEKKSGPCSEIATALGCISLHIGSEHVRYSVRQGVPGFIQRLEDKLFGGQLQKKYDRLTPLRVEFPHIQRAKAVVDLKWRLSRAIKQDHRYLEELRQDVTAFMDQCYDNRTADTVNSVHHLVTKKTSSQQEDMLEDPNLVYKTLNKCLQCQCSSITIGDDSYPAHPGRLLLSPNLRRDEHNNVQLDMLFFSSTYTENIQRWQWQDVRLLIARQAKSSFKKARFAGIEDSTTARLIHHDLESISSRQFCEHLLESNRSRLRFTINRERLYRSRPSAEDIDCFVVPPGVSLTTVLHQFQLTIQMKVTLAYILAKAAWRYYNSDWMNSLWTSDTIYFIAELDPEEGTTDLYVTKPYLSVPFQEADEIEMTSGAIHHDPWILTLGIMLVQIGRGQTLLNHAESYSNLSPIAKLNSDRYQAKSFIDLKKPWPGFDTTKADKYITPLERAYRDVASTCLTPQLFERSAGDTDIDRSRWLNKNRETLYNSVVAPLEALMQNTRFLGDMEIREAARLTERQKKLPIISNMEPISPFSEQNVPGNPEQSGISNRGYLLALSRSQSSSHSDVTRF